MDPKPNSNSESDSAGETFYNVMPQDTSGPKVFSAPSKIPKPVSGGQSEANTFSLPRSNRKVGMFVGIIIAVIILAVFGWFGYRYAKQHQTVKSTTNQNTQPAVNDQPPAPTGVTTPADWQKRYFSSEQCTDMNVCADSADPDRDGLSNLEEYNLKTDPNNADSDADGLSDGDEVHIFSTSPLTTRTNSSVDYTDADFVKGGYDVATNDKYTPEKLTEIKSKIKDKGLHQPTIKTLGADALKQYDFTDITLTTTTTDSSTIDSSIDQSPTAKLTRDTQRSNTIKKVAGALIKYKATIHSYPDTTVFADMISKVKSYVAVATNYDDPINKDKYVYGYVPSADSQSFTLLYFSETQNLVIKYTDQQAELDLIKDNASANDNIRIHDVENIARALGIYSDAHTAANGTSDKVFPPQDTYKTELVPQYLTVIPKDPRTGQDYAYEPGDHFDTFTLKATFDNPPKGQTGYMCNQLECNNY